MSILSSKFDEMGHDIPKTRLKFYYNNKCTKNVHLALCRFIYSTKGLEKSPQKAQIRLKIIWNLIGKMFVRPPHNIVSFPLYTQQIAVKITVHFIRNFSIERLFENAQAIRILWCTVLRRNFIIERNYSKIYNKCPGTSPRLVKNYIEKASLKLEASVERMI